MFEPHVRYEKSKIRRRLASLNSEKIAEWPRRDHEEGVDGGKEGREEERREERGEGGSMAGQEWLLFFPRGTRGYVATATLSKMFS